LLIVVVVFCFAAGVHSFLFFAAGGVMTWLEWHECLACMYCYILLVYSVVAYIGAKKEMATVRIEGL
jgi:hypothetical protein